MSQRPPVRHTARACAAVASSKSHPGQLQPVDEVSGWRLDVAAKAEIDRILRDTVADPVGPEFMAPPART